jgi:hypothetical protein
MSNLIGVIVILVLVVFMITIGAFAEYDLLRKVQSWLDSIREQK